MLPTSDWFIDDLPMPTGRPPPSSQFDPAPLSPPGLFARHRVAKRLPSDSACPTASAPPHRLIAIRQRSKLSEPGRADRRQEDKLGRRRRAEEAA